MLFKQKSPNFGKYFQLLGLLIGFTALSHLAAFSANPHRIIAQIAQNHLEPAARNAILQILNTGQKSPHLAEISNWPDEIRSDAQKWSYTFPWHYLRIADSQSLDNYVIHQAGDLLWALGYFEALLRNERAPTNLQRWQVLAFYVHLVGDAHQPLHISRIADNGGNNFDVKWFNESTNLQAVWDSRLSNYRRLSYTEHAAFIDTASAIKIRQVISNNTYLGWAKESRALHPQVYNVPEDRKISFQYADANAVLVEQRMLNAGLRLADKLNRIFNSTNFQQ